MLCTDTTRAPACATEENSDSSYEAAAQFPTTELDQHTQDCGRLLEEAYARFELTGNPHDRDEAVMWLAKRNAALRATRWEPCYFDTMGAVGRARMEGSTSA